MVKVTLDAETFKALASATRLTVLRALDERRKTLTELSRELDLNKATVHEHLALLTAADLVKKRDDEGRKWVYYELTWRGQKILHPQETTTFNVLLGLGMAAAGGGVAMLVRALQQAHDSVGLRATEDSGPAGGSAPSLQAASDDGSQGTEPSPAPASPESPSSQPPPEGQGAPEQAGDSDVAFDMEARKSGTDGTSVPEDGFFDHGGWVAVALLACALLFAVLAVFLRRRLKGAPPKEAALLEDARSRAESQRP